MANQVKLKCLHCGYEYSTADDPYQIERVCPKCRSNSVRLVEEKKG